MTRPGIIRAALLAALAAPAAHADHVSLDNGDRLTGKIVNLGKDKLTLETKYAGKIEIPRDRVRTIEADEPLPVLRNGESALSRASGALPLAEIAFVNPTPEQSGIGVAYSGRLDLSLAQVRGNSRSGTAVIDAALEARARRHRANLAFNATRASESGKETASKWRASASFDRFADARRFRYARASVERDRFGGIGLRSTLGAGYGVQVRDGERTSLSLRGGVEVVSLRAVDGARDEHPALGWGVRYRHKIFAERAEVFHEQDGYWSLARASDVTLRTRTGVRVPVAERLNASLQLDLDWSQDPEPDREPADSTLLLGLDYAW
jgi:putative salt-induced outer membrane protein YdiY